MKKKAEEGTSVDGKQIARQRLFHFHITVGVTSAIVFAYWLFGKISGLHIPCTFALLFHLYCPGCGCTRAAEALFRLDPLASLVANPSVLLGGITLLYYEAVLILRVRRGEGKPPSYLPAILFLIFFLGYTALRNILLVTLRFDPLGDHFMFWS